MERTMKVLAVLLVVCCLGAAVQASVFTMNGPGQDWNNINAWKQDGVSPATRVPSLASSDYTDIVYSAAANPTKIQAADASTRYLYLSLYTHVSGDGISGGGLALTNGYDLSTYRIMYGGSTTGSNVNPGAGSLLDIGAGSVVSCSSYFGNYINQTNTLSNDYTQVINVSGTLNTPILRLNDGVFNMTLLGAGTLKVTTDVDITNNALTLNFNSNLASIITTAAQFSELLGSIKVGGVAATMANFQTSDAGGGLTSYMLVPEPATMALLGLGAIAAFRRKR
jgi:hypothetical protein